MVPISGNYPDVPSYRIPWDIDGSVLVTLNSGAASPVVRSAGERTVINNEVSDGFQVTTAQNAGGTPAYVCVLFAEPQDLKGIFAETTATPSGFDTSVDSTSGQDGTWIARGSWASQSTTSAYRSGITAVNYPGIRSIRFRVTQDFYAPRSFSTLHLYGVRSEGATSDRLDFWHPTLDQRADAAYFDWADRARGSASSRAFRIKNLSSVLTANSVAIGAEALTEAPAPSIVSQTSFSVNGDAFAATKVLASLGPASLSPVITAKQDLSVSTNLGLWTQRYYARAGSWS